MKRIDDNLAFMLKFENVAWYESGEVRILDRRIYPSEISFVHCKSHKEVSAAITKMVTQSAGPYTALGMGMALAAYESRGLKDDERLDYLIKAGNTLANSRPTTADRMRQVSESCIEVAKKNINLDNLDEIIFEHTVKSMINRYEKIESVAKHLVKLFPQHGKVLTQCFGETIVGMMLRESRIQNKTIKLICPETRPFLQGARFTASVAADMGFDVTVITDNMVAFAMENLGIDLFTSAADSICLDGNIVNKVGTYQIAILAKNFKIPYFVTGIPDINHKLIESVEIEYRNPDEVLEFRGEKHTLEGVKGIYPSFDITPPHLVSGVVTDRGIYSPYDLNEYSKLTENNFYTFAV